jgi:hypothetical protein
MEFQRLLESCGELAEFSHQFLMSSTSHCEVDIPDGEQLPHDIRCHLAPGVDHVEDIPPFALYRLLMGGERI